MNTSCASSVFCFARRIAFDGEPGLIPILAVISDLDELFADLELDIADVRERVAYLAEFDQVNRDGEIVRPAE